MCCELSGGHFAEDRRTFCRKKADILPNMGGHFVEWWTFCRSPRARVRSFRSPASPTRGLAVLQLGEEGRQRRSQARRSGQRVPHRGHPAAFSCPAGGRPARGGRNGVNTARKGFFWRLEPGWGRSVESRRIRQGVPQGSPWGNASGMSPLRTGHMDHAGPCRVMSGHFGFQPGRRGAAASASRTGGIRRRFPVRQGAGQRGAVAMA